MTAILTNEQLLQFRRAAMERCDHYALCLCNRALRAEGSARSELVASILAHEDLRESVLRGEA